MSELRPVPSSEKLTKPEQAQQAWLNVKGAYAQLKQNQTEGKPADAKDLVSMLSPLDKIKLGKKNVSELPNVNKALKDMGQDTVIAQAVVNEYREARKAKDTKKVKEAEKHARMLGIALPAEDPGRRGFLMKAGIAGLSLALAGTGLKTAYGLGRIDEAGRQARAKINDNTSSTSESPIADTALQKAEVLLPEVGNFNPELIRPLAEAIFRAREERALRDPESLKRIDPEINKDRITFVIHNYGESHEPPNDRIPVTSTTWMSWDLKTGGFDSFSVTHDIRTPEAERELKRQGHQDVKATKIDSIHGIGGVPLLAETAENITGLYSDAVIVTGDDMVVDGINQIFGTLPVDVPRDFKVHPYWLKGVKQPEGEFEKGVENMNGKRALQYVKTLPKGETADGGYPAELNHNILKKGVQKGLIDTLGRKLLDENLWVSILDFLGDSISDRKIQSNMDPRIFLQTVDHVISNLPRAAMEKARGRLPTPFSRNSTYISDWSRGDGGLIWASSVKETDPVVIDDKKRGLYGNSEDMRAFKVPTLGNPYSDDLPRDYYGSTRKIVKERILAQKAA